MMKVFLTAVPFLLLPILGLGAAETERPAPEEPVNLEAEPAGESEEGAPETAETSTDAQASTEVASVPASASALERLGSDFNAVPLQGTSPRRGSAFFFDIPGLDTVEVSPN